MSILVDIKQIVLDLWALSDEQEWFELDENWFQPVKYTPESGNDEVGVTPKIGQLKMAGWTDFQPESRSVDTLDLRNPVFRTQYRR